jgi:hypothetical protein
MAVRRGVGGLLLQADGEILIGGDFSNVGPAAALTMARSSTADAQSEDREARMVADAPPAAVVSRLDQL